MTGGILVLINEVLSTEIDRSMHNALKPSIPAMRKFDDLFN
jgi:hypothetical protein